LAQRGRQSPTLTARPWLDAHGAGGHARPIVTSPPTASPLLNRRLRRTAPTLGALLALALGPLGCAGGGDPRGALKAHLRTVNRGELRRAYGRLSERYRREVSEKDFVASARASGSDLKESQKAFLASSQPPRVRAHLTYGPGERLDLVVEDGQW